MATLNKDILEPMFTVFDYLLWIPVRTGEDNNQYQQPNHSSNEIVELGKL